MVSGMNVLFNLLVVNNWTECEIGYEYVTGGKCVRFFFFAFHVVGVVVINNVVIAFIINAFFQQLKVSSRYIAVVKFFSKRYIRFQNFPRLSYTSSALLNLPDAVWSSRLGRTGSGRGSDQRRQRNIRRFKHYRYIKALLMCINRFSNPRLILHSFICFHSNFYSICASLGTATGASGTYIARVRPRHMDVEVDERAALRHLFTRTSSSNVD